MSTALARLHRHRERQRHGRIWLKIEVDEVALAEALIAVELLALDYDHGGTLEQRRAALAAAVTRLVETWTREL